MKYQVLDNGKPADCFNHEVHVTWNQSTFDTLEEAREYFDKWFFPYCHSDLIMVNTSYEYYEDCFGEIREIDNPKSYEEILKELSDLKEEIRKRILADLSVIATEKQMTFTFHAPNFRGFDISYHPLVEGINNLLAPMVELADILDINFPSKSKISPIGKVD